ncbi:MAG: hypothetical protein K0R38_4310 [Polyangiaceae bacterium]|jgi:hypothetical protein|nr:hypothetical protein [Polyangiaceae bacterium]
MRHHRSLLAWLGLAAATVTVAALASKLLAARQTSLRTTERRVLPPRWLDDELPPDSTVLEPAPASSRHVSAQPRDYARRPFAAEDAEAIGADELGSAFLARATGGEMMNDADEEDDLSGFQIHEGWR